MSDTSDALLAAIAGSAAGVRVLQATFVSGTSTGCQVDVGDSRVPAVLGTSFLPEVNEVVWLWNIGDWFFIMGPAQIKPDQGVVQSVAGGLVTLTTSFGTTVVAPYTGATPSAGQSMKLLWHGGPFAMLMSTSPAGNAPPPAPSTGATSHAPTFPAIDAGSFGSGRWWTPQVWASDSNLGAWFYGSKIADTIPAAADIQKVEIYIGPSSQISGDAPNFATHAYGTKPGSSPALSTIAAVAIEPGWVTLPNTFGFALRAGGGALGVGLNHGGENILPSLGQDGMSGTLRITSVY